MNLVKTENSLVFQYIVAALLGLAVVLKSFPLDFLSGQVGFYYGDRAANVSGYYAFRDTAWHFPIFWTDRLNYPEGISIINTDSIPLVALIVKPFSSLLPNDFHYFGLWYGIAYILQAISAVFLLRQLGCRKWYLGLLAACFSLLSPVFITRAGHVALMTHAIVIFALGLYFQALRQYGHERPPAIWFLAWIVLIGGSFLIHPYLTAMIVPIYVAAIFDNPVIRGSWRSLVLSICAPIITLIAVYSFFWYAPGNSPAKSTSYGFGVYSMNLLAPLVGGKIVHWGKGFLPTFGQSFEGFNYFGLGVIGIILIAICLQRSNFLKILYKHKFLVLLFLVLTIYSLSNHIYAGKLLILSYPDWLTKAINPISGFFRVSGRFFWPVNYAILFSALYFILSSGRKWAIWFAVGMLLVQIIDVHESRFSTIETHDSYSQQIYPEETWSKLIRGKKALFLIPGWMCGAKNEEILPLQVLAAKNQVIVNTAYASRQSPKCKEKLNFALSNIDKNTLHVYFNRVPREQVEEWMGTKANEWCRRYSRGIVCAPYPDSDDLEVLNSDDFLSLSSNNIQFFMAYTLPGDIGEVNLTSRSALSKRDHPGYLSRGPFIQLLTGEYHFRLKYKSPSSRDTEIGQVKIFTKEYQGLFNQGNLGLYPINGSMGNQSVVEGTFDISSNLTSDSLEIRVFWAGVEDMQIDSLTIYELDNQSIE